MGADTEGPPEIPTEIENESLGEALSIITVPANPAANASRPPVNPVAEL